MQLWKTHEILIFAKTYPEISSKYLETVCTGGITTRERIPLRLYPIPFRYLDGEKQFKKYDLVRFEITKNPSDSRPESYKVRPDSIEILNHVGTENNWAERKRFILNDTFVFSSLEELKAKQRTDGTSLGAIKPKEIQDFLIERKSSADVEITNEKLRSVQSQSDLFREIKNLMIPEYRFLLRFKCDDSSCTGHRISIIDWELFELYRRVRKNRNWKELIRNKVCEICNPKNDLYFFFGNLSHPAKREVFCIAGFFYPREEPYRQMPLFD
jgi:hypothetical protein